MIDPRHEPTEAQHRRSRAPAVILAAIAVHLLSGCGPSSSLETRTFDLAYLDPDEAAQMVRPYVYEDRGPAGGMIETFTSGLTVRERPEALDRIAEVLAQYDVQKPAVRLHFQLIEADGFEDEDDRIADIRQALEDLFRFEGYRLVDEARLALVERARASQEGAATTRTFSLVSFLSDVDEAGSAVTVSVTLSAGVMGDVIATTLTVPVGETVVLGSSRRASEPTLILTVRPELIDR
jgi:hypothetical protein